MAGATLWTDCSCLVLLKLKCLQNMLDGTRSVFRGLNDCCLETSYRFGQGLEQCLPSSRTIVSGARVPLWKVASTGYWTRSTDSALHRQNMAQNVGSTAQRSLRPQNSRETRNVKYTGLSFQ